MSKICKYSLLFPEAQAAKWKSDIILLLKQCKPIIAVQPQKKIHRYTSDFKKNLHDKCEQKNNFNKLYSILRYTEEGKRNTADLDT